MNDMSDDHLKEVFGKLKNFESTEEGIAWHSVSQQLPKPSVGTKMSRFASVLTILSAGFLLVTVNERELKNQQVNIFVLQKSTNSPQAMPSKNVQPKIRRIKASNTDLKLSNGQITPHYSQRKENEQPFSKVENLSKIHQPKASLDRSRLESLMNRPIKITGKLIELEKPSLRMIDRKKNEVKSFAMSISPSYMFGVVDPLPNDAFFVHDYNSEAGLGLKFEVTKGIHLFRSIRVQTGPSFSYLKKNFDFSITQFNPESTTERVLRENYGSSYVGWNFYFESQNHNPWTAGIGFNKNLGKDKNLNRFLGDTFLSLGVSRSITKNRSTPFIFKPGISFSLPLTGRIEYFRYYPIQMTLTIQHPFCGRN